MKNLFQPLIQELEQQGISYSEPQSFQQYSGISGKTAEYISVQSFEKLKPELRDASYMVFRLGSRVGDSTTYFAIAKLKQLGQWSEYFLLDHEIFEETDPEIFLPNVSIRQLFAFNLLSGLTENSLINLAVSSGLLASALGIESSESLAAPASGQGTFTFEFQASRDAPIWLHNAGQVEIDALFIGKQKQKETLFVIEAKTSNKLESLAKHKLVYPVLGLRKKVPKYISMVPVYIRVLKLKDKREIHFYIAICKSLDNSGVASVSELEVIEVKHLVLLGFSESFMED